MICPRSTAFLGVFRVLSVQNTSKKVVDSYCEKERVKIKFLQVHMNMKNKAALGCSLPLTVSYATNGKRSKDLDVLIIHLYFIP